MKLIILDNGDGTIGVLVPAPEYMAKLMVSMTEDEAIDHVVTKDGGGKAGVVVDSANMPPDRTFRGAWKPHAEGVEVDMPRAQVIQMDRIRGRRDEKLKELDIEQLKGNDVSAQKQTLRDIPSTFDLTTAPTPEELKALWPSELEAG